MKAGPSQCLCSSGRPFHGFWLFVGTAVLSSRTGALDLRLATSSPRGVSIVLEPHTHQLGQLDADADATPEFWHKKTGTPGHGTDCWCKSYVNREFTCDVNRRGAGVNSRAICGHSHVPAAHSRTGALVYYIMLLAFYTAGQF